MVLRFSLPAISAGELSAALLEREGIPPPIVVTSKNKLLKARQLPKNIPVVAR
jgi:hypothetical protein